MNNNPIAFPDPTEIMCGYLTTPANMHLVKKLISYDERIEANPRTSWDEYGVSGTSIYPHFLNILVDGGIAFGWEYMCTEDFSYFAYNYPTEDTPTGIHFFNSSGRRKQLPRITQAQRSAIETTSAANELLYTMGIKNGSN